MKTYTISFKVKVKGMGHYVEVEPYGCVLTAFSSLSSTAQRAELLERLKERHAELTEWDKENAEYLSSIDNKDN